MAKKKKKEPVMCDCKECTKQFDKNETKRMYGTLSIVYIGGFCSAFCYTKSLKLDGYKINSGEFLT